jgi:hypothetical protein
MLSPKFSSLIHKNGRLELEILAGTSCELYIYDLP